MGRLSRASAAPPMHRPVAPPPSPRPVAPAPLPTPPTTRPPGSLPPPTARRGLEARGAAASPGRAVHGARGGPGSGCEDAGVGLPPRPDPTPPCRPHPRSFLPGRACARGHARKSVVGGALLCPGCERGARGAALSQPRGSRPGRPPASVVESPPPRVCRARSLGPAAARAERPPRDAAGRRGTHPRPGLAAVAQRGAAG